MKKKFFSNSSLKIIAICAMLIDHFGAIILENVFIMKAPYSYFSDRQFTFLLNSSSWTNIIGDLAFPIFCFLLVEGFIHTSNLKRYFFSLLIIAFLSEPIYDWSLTNSWMNLDQQNVLFTLLSGLGMLVLLKRTKNNWALSILIVSVTATLSYLTHLDGWYFGIGLIAIFYLLRQKALKYLLAAIFMYLCGLNFTLNGLLDPYFLSSLTTLLILFFYNGKRGLSLKYTFYIFYPLHLLILKLVGLLLTNLFNF